MVRLGKVTRPSAWGGGAQRAQGNNLCLPCVKAMLHDQAAHGDGPNMQRASLPSFSVTFLSAANYEFVKGDFVRLPSGQAPAGCAVHSVHTPGSLLS